MRARALPAFLDALTDEERLPVACFARSGPVVALGDRAAAVVAAVPPSQAIFAVVDGERFVGIVTHAALVVAAASPHLLTVAAVVERGVPTVDAWSSVAAAQAAVERSRRGVAAVTSGGSRYLGLVRAADLVRTRW
jgi:IMP cyclohydrolase